MPQRMFALATGVALLAAASGFAQPMADPAKTDSGTLERDARALAQLWEGEFENTRQFRELAAQNRIAPKDRPAERLYIYRRFTHPELRGTGLYVQQHYIVGGKPGPAYRQRLYDVYADTSRQRIVVEIYSLTPEDEKAVIDAHRNPSILATVPRARMTPLPAGCEIFWTRQGEGFVGIQREGDCVMDFPRSTLKMTLADDLTLDARRFTTKTRARSLDGKPLFGDAVTLELDRRVPLRGDRSIFPKEK